MTTLTQEQIETQLALGELDVPEPPRPLRRPLPPAQAYPIAALGSNASKAVEALRDIVQAPDAICAQSILAVMNLAVQAHGNVALFGEHARPVSCYFVSIAESGDRKSTVDAYALKSVRSHEQNLRDHYEHDSSVYRHARAMYEKDHQLIINSKESRASKLEKLKMLGEQPVPPLEPMMLIVEPTYEGLVRNFQFGQPSQGLFSSEGGRFLGGYAMTQDNKLKTGAALSELWDGQVLNRCRKGDGSVSLPGRRLCSHLMLQPGVSKMLLADETLADQGLSSRLLVAYPESIAGQRPCREPDSGSLQALSVFHGQLRSILEASFPLREGTRNELQPRKIKPDSASRRLLASFADHIESQLRPNGELVTVKNFANKLPEHAGRLAGTIALFEDLNISELRYVHLEAGIKLAQYYLGEVLRLFFAGAADPLLLQAEELLMWLHNGRSTAFVSLPCIYQLGPNRIRDKKKAERLVDVLEDHGWLRSVEGGARINGQHRRQVWQITGWQRPSC